MTVIVRLDGRQQRFIIYTNDVCSVRNSDGLRILEAHGQSLASIFSWSSLTSLLIHSFICDGQWSFAPANKRPLVTESTNSIEISILLFRIDYTC